MSPPRMEEAGDRLRAAALAFLFALAPAFAGCFGAPLQPTDVPGATSLADLQAPNAKETIDSGGMRTFTFAGESGFGARAFLVPVPETWSYSEAFEVDARVGYVEANLTFNPQPPADLMVFLLDPEGRIQCGGTQMRPPKSCTAPVPSNATRKETWSFKVVTGAGFPAGGSSPGIPFDVSVTLHPRSHLVFGDLLAGVDPAIRFRVADTGATRGSEPNLGLLADGTLFAQETLQTMRSRDDGKTWEDVAPVTTSQRTFDPMLRVDPWSGTVYVDQLYIGCSILAWTTDAGESWTTNPAACGMPANDHQKIAVGPSPIAASPLPVVYYSFMSFVDGVWVSRSLDGGLTWTTAPVVGITDARQPSNTGPVEADREGNVYVPMYFCDGDGYVGAGVSNDFGATFRFVEVAADPGPCYDVDPGLAVDTEGTAYFAYHRPDGVKYSFSKDHGATWSEPVLASPPGLRSFVHVDAVAGDAGRLAIAYRATPDTAKGPDAADGWARWGMYVAFVENATDAAPAIRNSLVHAPDDPVQRGAICTTGVLCVGGSRNLLDFIDVAVGPDGRVYVAYTDGCDPSKSPAAAAGEAACPVPSSSRSNLPLVAVQEDGPRLFVDRAPWASAAPARALGGLWLPALMG